MRAGRICDAAWIPVGQLPVCSYYRSLYLVLIIPEHGSAKASLIQLEVRSSFGVTATTRSCSSSCRVLWLHRGTGVLPSIGIELTSG
jgi:hypothetical protein